MMTIMMIDFHPPPLPPPRHHHHHHRHRYYYYYYYYYYNRRLTILFQAALETARKELTNDMSQNFARGKVCQFYRKKTIKIDVFLEKIKAL